MGPDNTDKGYPLRYESTLLLRDGREVFLRPILPADREHLIDLFNRISPQSLYQRFLTRPRSLPEDMLYHFTHVDYASAFALVAVVGEEGRDAVVAVARYAPDPQGSLTDLAIAVRDDWQNLGLGKTMLAKLIAVAREHGITRFGSMMDARNIAIEKTLRELGLEVKHSLLNGFYRVEIVI